MACLASDIFSCTCGSLLAVSNGLKTCQPWGQWMPENFSFGCNGSLLESGFYLHRKFDFSVVFVFLCMDLSTFRGGQLCLGSRLLAALVARGAC